MIATIVISSITFVTIMLSLLLFPKLRIGKRYISTYWIIALIGAIILLATSLSPAGEVFNQLTVNNSINPIKILVLFFSMTLLSIFLDEFGLFQYLANLAVKNAKGSQYALFFSFYALVAVLTVFTSNDVVILTFTPFICFFCKRTHLNPLPYLIAEFTAANTWSLMLMIGNPTNIFLATSAGITFIDYIKVMAIPTILSGSVELLIIFLLFKRMLKEKITNVDEEENRIENKPMLIIGVIHLIICLIFLVIASYINIEMWIVSLSCAGSLTIFTLVTALITKKNIDFIPGALKRLPYPLIPFFLSMFVIVVAYNYQGLSIKIAELFGSSNTIWIYGISSFLASNIINNISMSILYSNLCNSLEGFSYISAVYASIIGSNIGAFLTPMGALAGIMFMNLVFEHGVKFRFLDFIKYGIIVSAPTIITALLTLSLTINWA